MTQTIARIYRLLRNHGNLSRGFLILLALFLALFSLFGCGPKRSSRKHSNQISEEFKHLIRRFAFDSAPNIWLATKQAEQDLDELEWLLENRYSYLKLKGVDYRSALDSIRGSLGEGINRSDFGYQLTKFLALFGDGHSHVRSSTVRLKSLSSAFLPFLVEESAGRFVAFKPDRSDFLDPEFLFLQALDGIPVNEWLQVASQYVAKGSPQFQRYRTLRNLRYVECLRKELDLDESSFVQVKLESADASATKLVKLPLAKKGPIYGFWPRSKTLTNRQQADQVESHILQGNIGYLRFVFMSAERKFLNDLIEAMNHFARTDALIIDIRTNVGGSRAPLRVLFPFIMTDNDSPQVVNVAAYRVGIDNIKEDFK